MNQFLNRKCIICEKPFKYRTSSKRKTSNSIRSKNSLTCSPKCSRVYTRISHHIYSTFFRNKKVLKSKKGFGRSYGYK